MVSEINGLTYAVIVVDLQVECINSVLNACGYVAVEDKEQCRICMERKAVVILYSIKPTHTGAIYSGQFR